jgi:hypothetical protein
MVFEFRRSNYNTLTPKRTEIVAGKWGSVLQVDEDEVIPYSETLCRPIKSLLQNPPNRGLGPLKLNPPRQLIKPYNSHSQHQPIPTNKPTIQRPPRPQKRFLRIRRVLLLEGTPDRENEDGLEGFDVAGDTEDGVGEETAGFVEEGGY